MFGASLSLLPLALLVSIADATNYDVTVGKGSQLKFDPEAINAQPGDTVTYHYFAKNHSVTQSSFADPCHPVDGGFFSGFVATASPDVAAATTFQITVHDTKPIWVYCSQTNGDHCQKGMVSSINAPTSGNTLDAFKAKAATASTSTSPPGGLPVGGTRTLHIDVGLGGNLTFTPNNVTNELPGTVVEFSFNPANHSVVQSSFQDPCHPSAGGFSSGFIPTSVSPSGVLFDVVLNDTKPVWFYCAQTKKTHCQAGMVGSINAPTSGNSLEAFIDLARKASESTIPPEAPLGGILAVNGTIIATLHGNVLNVTALDQDTIGWVPPPGQNMSDYVAGMAGGGPPNSYNWGSQISDNATEHLQILQWLDNILLEILFDGYNKLNGGSWTHVYPQSIVDILGSLSAQALVHRSTATDSLQHYQKQVLGVCTYNLPTMNVDAFLHAALTVLLLEIGVILDIISLVSSSDPWMVPALATQLGSKSRMTGVINLMQGHMAAAAAREVMLPAQFAYSYGMNNYVSKCPDKLDWLGDPLPPLQFTSTQKLGNTDRVTSATIAIDASSQKDGQLYIAWLGPWGSLSFSPVESGGVVQIPTTLYGHVWAVLVKQSNVKLHDLPGVAVAGPEMLWVAGV